jgi:nitrite reductase (NADH) small subunit
MSQFVRVCSQSELPAPGTVAEFTVDSHAVCVANVGGAISVLNGVCPHEEGPLGEGSVEDGRIVCPWHGYSFDPKTGISPEDPSLRAQIYESVMENGELRAKL